MRYNDRKTVDSAFFKNYLKGDRRDRRTAFLPRLKLWGSMPVNVMRAYERIPELSIKSVVMETLTNKGIAIGLKQDDEDLARIHGFTVVIGDNIHSDWVFLIDNYTEDAESLDDIERILGRCVLIKNGMTRKISIVTEDPDRFKALKDKTFDIQWLGTLSVIMFDKEGCRLTEEYHIKQQGWQPEELYIF